MIPDVFLAVALGALSLLVVHAVSKHGRSFAAIWLGLPSVALLGLAFLLNSRLRMPDFVPAWLEFTGAFYVSAVSAKGLMERSRRGGSPLSFAAATAVVAAAFAAFLAEADSRTIVDSGATDCLMSIALWWNPIRAVPSGFVLGFVAFCFLYAFAYGWVSTRTSRNGKKLAVLGALCGFLAAPGLAFRALEPFMIWLLAKLVN